MTAWSVAEKIGRFMLEVFDPLRSRHTIKISAFNQEAQEPRCGDPGTWLDKKSVYMSS
jgi:hypothetical protein